MAVFIPYEALLNTIKRSRCIASTLPIPEDGHFFDSQWFNDYFDKPIFFEYMDLLFESIDHLLDEPSAKSIGIHEKIHKLFGDLVSKNAKWLQERHVHWYIKTFHDTIWRDPEDKIGFVEIYSEMETKGASSNFAKKVVPRIREKDTAFPDLIGLSGNKGRTLTLVEIKLDTIDDRAVGQLLRYYSIAKKVVDGYQHDCDIWNIQPVLIIKNLSNRNFVEAWPQHFRELVKVFIYTPSEKGGVVLRPVKI